MKGKTALGFAGIMRTAAVVLFIDSFGHERILSEYFVLSEISVYVYTAKNFTPVTGLVQALSQRCDTGL